MEEMKIRLYQTCLEQTMERIQMIEDRFQAIRESRDNETKSSVGDKYETGRAMMQMEEDKAKGQLFQAQNTLNELQKIKNLSGDEITRAGSLVETNNGLYYIAIGLGKLKLDGKLFYCISTEAPIAKQLLGKKQGAQVSFNGRMIKILGIY